MWSLPIEFSSVSVDEPQPWWLMTNLYRLQPNRVFGSLASI